MAGSWTSPSTWSNGTVVTDTMLNAQLRDNLLWLGGTAGIISLSGYNAVSTAGSTTSASLVVINAPQVGSFVTAGGNVGVWFGGSFSHNAAGTACTFAIFMDGASIGTVAHVSAPGTNTFFNVSGSVLHNPAGGTHLYQIAWATASGTLSVDTNTTNWISAVEFRR